MISDIPSHLKFKENLVCIKIHVHILKMMKHSIRAYAAILLIRKLSIEEKASNAYELDVSD